MKKNNPGVNLLFVCVILALAAVALVSLYQNMGRPPIQEAPAPDPSSMQLPENHPPLDVSKRLSDLEKMSQANPENPEYQTQIGNIYYDQGQYQKAIEAYEASLKLKPQDAGVETDLGTSFHFLGQEDKALEVLNKVLQYSPGFPQAMFNKGIVLLDGKHDAKGAIAVWEDLLRTNPAFPERAQLEKRIRDLRSSGK